ncbi:MAG: hypothetical protein AVDCRST_MAG67-1145 [uncultured Solirubrobacteraceae bacterium]|uniref:Uncharacterized protein n=1 Tax=uncultured Solirubrobacteraceae bacterium TaxID=1162706 RepID=A0A6J4S320_9ACTN|nr:MAG: hypothetical protein AVDCRST_MAG67-1145 [uncultured Solirubrobacteraceae bacterium]
MRRATARPLWLPYVEVAQINEATEGACRFGATVLLGPRKGPSGLAKRRLRVRRRGDRVLAAKSERPWR